MSKHIAFFNIPAVGHVYPTLGLVAELVRRGYRVSYATIDRRAAVVESAGARVVRYASLRPSDTDPDVRPPERSGYLGQTLLAFLEEAQSTLPQIEPAFAGDPPDLVVHDRMSFAGRAYAAKHGIPTIQSWPILVSNEIWSLGDLFGTTFDASEPAYQTYLARLGEWLVEQRTPLTPENFLTPTPRCHLAFFPRAFQYHGERFDDTYRFVGPCLRPRPAGPRWHPTDPDRPVLMVTLGTVYNRQPDFYRTCFAAFADSPWQVVLAIGERMDPASLGPAPANIDVRRVVPQLDVLRYASALLCQAGMGGIMEAMIHGVPVVGLPQTMEQDANADRVEQLRLGLRLPSSMTPEVLRKAVDSAASDGTIVKGIAAMQREIAAAGGVSRAGDIVAESL